MLFLAGQLISDSSAVSSETLIKFVGDIKKIVSLAKASIEISNNNNSVSYTEKDQRSTLESEILFCYLPQFFRSEEKVLDYYHPNIPDHFPLQKNSVGNGIQVRSPSRPWQNSFNISCSSLKTV